MRQFGLTQGRELAGIGINLNFAPVVDLNYEVKNPNDRFTRISQRAIPATPRLFPRWPPGTVPPWRSQEFVAP